MYKRQIAVMAIAEKGGLLHAPDMYMEKLCVGPRGAGAIDITKSLTENIKNVAAKMERNVDEITLVMLDRERHQGLMKEAREVGARIMLISDGDVNPAMECCIEGSGVHMLSLIHIYRCGCYCCTWSYKGANV